MVRSSATSVDEYLATLPDDRRAVISAVRDVILENLPKGYTETINWGMITYEVPLERYPDTYNGQPLMYAALAAHKHHYAVYLTAVYQDLELAKWLKDAFAKAGKKLDMGKSCVRFKKLENLPLEVIGEVVRSMPVKEFIRRHEELSRR